MPTDSQLTTEGSSALAGEKSNFASLIASVRSAENAYYSFRQAQRKVKEWDPRSMLPKPEEPQSTPDSELGQKIVARRNQARADVDKCFRGPAAERDGKPLEARITRLIDEATRTALAPVDVAEAETLVESCTDWISGWKTAEGILSNYPELLSDPRVSESLRVKIVDEVTASNLDTSATPERIALMERLVAKETPLTLDQRENVRLKLALAKGYEDFAQGNVLKDGFVGSEFGGASERNGNKYLTPKGIEVQIADDRITAGDIVQVLGEIQITRVDGSVSTLKRLPIGNGIGHKAAIWSEEIPVVFARLSQGEKARQDLALQAELRVRTLGYCAALLDFLRISRDTSIDKIKKAHESVARALVESQGPDEPVASHYKTQRPNEYDKAFTLITKRISVEANRTDGLFFQQNGEITEARRQLEKRAEAEARAAQEAASAKEAELAAVAAAIKSEVKPSQPPPPDAVSPISATLKTEAPKTGFSGLLDRFGRGR